MESTIIKRRSFQFTGTTKEWLAFSICLICLFLFFISAYSKIEEHVKFMAGLSKVNIIGEYAMLISWAVPITEIVVVLLLAFPMTQKLGLYSFAVLMIVFTLYILSMLLWAEKLPCHCNLIIEKFSFREHLVFNTAFIALSILALWLMKSKK